ncbi:hypothetical protein DEFDS_P079 (plasmid) [Deferribacter desulfuricans SSM1]|uniref:Uncharacterized protein n=1 Tax=Deferribacter desulfuricans (strain DSM 14783 / JCM 11476 / NBRC 101012 / SSM1) TaxID=639282 RepID=D3PER1_DEFDS|nr:hypothetical protein [Deferribacter desulfuricans]BAI81703.1 hypothetical protein DEFDS_P079 [Deferribacter desulfuricans SSM1]
MAKVLKPLNVSTQYIKEIDNLTDTDMVNLEPIDLKQMKNLLFNNKNHLNFNKAIAEKILNYFQQSLRDLAKLDLNTKDDKLKFIKLLALNNYFIEYRLEDLLNHLTPKEKDAFIKNYMKSYEQVQDIYKENQHDFKYYLEEAITDLGIDTFENYLNIDKGNMIKNVVFNNLLHTEESLSNLIGNLINFFDGMTPIMILGSAFIKNNLQILDGSQNEEKLVNEILNLNVDDEIKQYLLMDLFNKDIMEYRQENNKFIEQNSQLYNLYIDAFKSVGIDLEKELDKVSRLAQKDPDFDLNNPKNLNKLDTVTLTALNFYKTVRQRFSMDQKDDLKFNDPTSFFAPKPDRDLSM